MSRNAFTLLVAALVVFIGYTFWAGNRLPGDIHKQIANEQSMLEAARRTVADDRANVAKAVASEPALFQVRGFDTQWQGRFGEANAALSDAAHYTDELKKIDEHNRRGDRRQAEQLVGMVRDRRQAAVSEADKVVHEAQKRLDAKRNFAQSLKAAESRVHTLAATDYQWLITKVEKAETDWPSKKDDLAKRLDAVTAPKKQATEWSNTIAKLEAKPAASLETADYAAALDVEEAVESAPSADQARDLDALRSQLYTSWDNVLEDLDKDNGRYREHIKKIVTTVPAPGVPGTTTSAQVWQDVSADQWKSVENDIGMAISHKPTGKYDSEADHTAEPAEYSYIASPSEGHNQYGYWEQRDGGSFWHWLPEYLILRELLSNHHYQPIPSYDWGRYNEARRYGKTWYGTDTGGAPKYGSHGTFTAQRYGSSRYVQSGGFSGSKYSSGGSRGMPSASASGKRFGSSSSSSSAGRTFGGSSSGRSFGSRSAGRSFGGGRRR